MLMTGKLFDAKRLLDWGYLDDVVLLGELDNAALRWANEYAGLPPIAAQMIKKSVNNVTGALDQAIMHMDSDQWLLALGSEDCKEAIAAFFEKRTPDFTGN